MNRISKYPIYKNLVKVLLRTLAITIINSNYLKSFVTLKTLKSLRVLKAVIAELPKI
jgi:hypothetical protein